MGNGVMSLLNGAEQFGATPECFDFLEKNIKFTHRDLKHFKTAFREIDIEKSGFVSIPEILFYFGIEETPCNFILFSHLVGGTKPQLSFVEFVMTMWNFLTIPQEDVALFLLTVCRINKSLHSDPKAILHLIHLIHFCENDLKERLDEVRSFSTIIVNHGQQIYDRQRSQTIAMDSVNEDDMEQLTGMLVSPFMNLQNRLWKEMLGVKNWMHLCEERKTLPEEYKYAYNLDSLANALSALLGLNTRSLSICSSMKSAEILPFCTQDFDDGANNVVEDNIHESKDI
jgi:hypothetical protein